VFLKKNFIVPEKKTSSELLKHQGEVEQSKPLKSDTVDGRNPAITMITS